MIRGVLLPVITPFDEKERLDETIMRELVDFHIGAGVHGLFVLGSTGQGPAMSTEERKRAAAVALDQAKGRVAVVIHVGTADTQSTVELAEHAAANNASAVAIVPPIITRIIQSTRSLLTTSGSLKRCRCRFLFTRIPNTPASPCRRVLLCA